MVYTSALKSQVQQNVMTHRLDNDDLIYYQGSIKFVTTKRMLNVTNKVSGRSQTVLMAPCRKKLKTPNGKLSIQDAVSFFITNIENR